MEKLNKYIDIEKKKLLEQRGEQINFITELEK